LSVADHLFGFVVLR